MSTFETVLLMLLVVDALALAGLVLIQQGRGADVGAAFGSGSSNTMFGSGGTASFLTKITVWLAIGFFMISFGLAYAAKERVMTEIALQQNDMLTELTRQYLSAHTQGRCPSDLLAAAWHEFYRIYSNFIQRLVHSHGLKGLDADDCVQDVWSEVVIRFPQLSHLDEQAKLRGWLYTIARSKAINLYRRASLRRGCIIAARSSRRRVVSKLLRSP